VSNKPGTGDLVSWSLHRCLVKLPMAQKVTERKASGRGAFLPQPVSLEQGTPRGDSRPALEQRAALAFRHTAPDPELGAIVQSVGKAFGDHGAAHANLLGELLGSASNEQGVRLSSDAGPLRRPLLDPGEMSC